LDLVAGAGRNGDFHWTGVMGYIMGLVKHNLLFLFEFLKFAATLRRPTASITLHGLSHR
jgi:hypothetical protein